MHISTLYGSTYSQNVLIKCHADIAHEDTVVKINLSEADCEAIQRIVTNAFLAERQKLAEAVLNNSPAYIALPPEPEPVHEEAEFEPCPVPDAELDDGINF